MPAAIRPRLRGFKGHLAIPSEGSQTPYQSNPLVMLSVMWPISGGRASPRRRHVLRVPITEAAHAAERGHALLKACEATIRAPAADIAATIVGAPRIVLGIRAAAECSGADDDAKDQKQ
jgi:hypothetical protein